MKRRDVPLSIALALSLVFIWLVAYFELDSFWGVSHVKYFGDYVWYFVGTLTVVILALMLLPMPERWLERCEQSLAGWLWGKTIIPKAIVSVGFAGLFYLFRVKTAFLGDGYFLLNVFGRSEAYLTDVVKPLSIWIIKTIQTGYGGYTYWTALYAFQTVSIVAGFFVIYNLIDIAGRLTDSNRGRLFALGTMIGSGWLLLFFGYIEYYPLLWLAALFFIRQSIKCVQGEASRWSVWLVFGLTISVHMQAIYFLPGVLFIQFSDYLTRVVSGLSTRTRSLWAMLGLVLPLGLVVIVGLFVKEIVNPFLSFLPLLPLVPIGSDFSDYAVLSLGNLREVINMILLVVPSAVVLFVLAFFGGAKRSDRVSIMFGLFSYGALCFLILMNPKLGLARDWDLMSLTLLAPMLLLLYRVGDWSRISTGVLLATLVFSGSITFSYLNANCRVAISEKRFFDLLQHYGTKDQGGWVSFSRYLANEGKAEFQTEVAAHMTTLFPELQKLEAARSLVARGELEGAELLVQRLIQSQPENGRFLSLLGDIRIRQGRIDEAIGLYTSALKTHPNHRNYFCLGRCYLLKNSAGTAVQYLQEAYRLAPLQVEVLAELCRAYGALGQLAPAKRYADELLSLDSKAPDGLVIAIIVAARSGDRTAARRYYRNFLVHGRDHPEYEAIKESFSDLAD